MLEISTGQSTLITSEEKTAAPNWLSDNDLLWLKSGDKGVTQLIVGNVGEIGKSYVAGIVPAPVSDVQIKVVDQEKISIAVVAKARPNGTLYNPEEEPKKLSSGMLYDSLMVRHWDKYVTPNRNAIWHGILERADIKGRYKLRGLTNILKGSRLESPIPPFGSLDNFDLGSQGIGFVAKDPDLNPATNTKSNFYFVTIENDSYATTYSEPTKVELGEFEGASTAPAFSPDGKGVAFLQMKQNGYESDKNRVIFASDYARTDAAFELLKSDDGKGLWDRSPGSISWSNDGKTLYMTAEDRGKVKLYSLPVPTNPRDMTELPTPLTDKGYVSDVQPLGADSSRLFLSSSNLIDNSVYAILDPADSAGFKVVSSNSRNGSFFGLSENQISDIWFEGSKEGTRVHAWVMKPSNFSSDKLYPLAYLIHG